MARRRAEAEVLLHDRPVGLLTFDAGRVEFQYDDDVSASGHRVLGQVFEEAPGRRYRELGLPAWFANLLPEGGFRRFLEREIAPGPVSDFRLLVLLGADLPGAVVVSGRLSSEYMDGEDLQPPTPPAPVHDDDFHPFSLAGVQNKLSLIRESDGRLTIPVRGQLGRWIAKLPDRTFPRLPENEHVAMLLLKAAGVQVPEVDLVPAGRIQRLPEGLVDPGEWVFVVRRFDRDSNDAKIHIEDFAQIAGIQPADKYDAGVYTFDGIGATIAALAGEADALEYVRRLVCMVIVGNTDAHAKNWSLYYPDGVHPRLAPAYDFVSTTVYHAGRYQRLPYQLGGQALVDHVRADHFDRVAAACELPVGQVRDVAAETVTRLRDGWERLRPDVSFEGLRAHLDERLTELEIVRDFA